MHHQWDLWGVDWQGGAEDGGGKGGGLCHEGGGLGNRECGDCNSVVGGVGSEERGHGESEYGVVWDGDGGVDGGASGGGRA